MGALPDILAAIAATAVTAAITARPDRTIAAAGIIMAVTAMATVVTAAAVMATADMVTAVTAMVTVDMDTTAMAAADTAAAGTAMAAIPTMAAGGITVTAGRIMAGGTAMVTGAGGATTTDGTMATGVPSPIAAISAEAGHTASRESDRASKNRPAEEGISADQSLIVFPMPE